MLRGEVTFVAKELESRGRHWLEPQEQLEADANFLLNALKGAKKSESDILVQILICVFQ